MITGLPVSSILQCNYTHHGDACRELFKAIERLEATTIDAHQASKMACKVMSFKSRIKPSTFLDENISCSHEVFKDFGTDMALRS